MCSADPCRVGFASEAESEGCLYSGAALFFLWMELQFEKSFDFGQWQPRPSLEPLQPSLSMTFLSLILQKHLEVGDRFSTALYLENLRPKLLPTWDVHSVLCL